MLTRGDALSILRRAVITASIVGIPVPKNLARRAIATVFTAVLVGAFTLVGVAPASADITVPEPVVGAPADPFGYTEYDGQLYFAAIADGDSDETVFAYDGSTFTQLPDSPVGVTSFKVFDGNLLIASGGALFSYDGTAVTPLVHPFANPSNFVEIDGILYFRGLTPGGWAVWQFDGAAFGAVSGDYQSAELLSSFGDKLYFNADADLTAAEDPRLFSYDPAVAGPALEVAGSPADPTAIGTHDGLGYLGSSDGGMYSFDGVAFTAIIGLAPVTSVSAFTSFQGALYFVAYDGISAFRLFSYSGGAIAPVPGGATETSELFEYEGSLYFLGWGDSDPVLFAVTNGVATEVAGSPAYAGGSAIFEGSLYFTGYDLVLEEYRMYVLTAFDLPIVPPAGPAGPALAATGAEFGMLAPAALVLLMLGAATLMVARRRAA